MDWGLLTFTRDGRVLRRQRLYLPAISTAATAGGGRKTFIAGMTTAHASTAHHQGPMVAQKEFAMTAGTRQKLGRVKEIVYCVM